MSDFQINHAPHPVSESAGEYIVWMDGKFHCRRSVSYDAHPNGVFECKSQREAAIAAYYMAVGMIAGVRAIAAQCETPKWPDFKIPKDQTNDQ